MSAEAPDAQEGGPEAPTYLVAGGGTAGHLLPGISVADELVARGVPRGHITFVGSERGPESEIVPAAGFEVELLPGRGIQRRISLQNLVSMFDLMRAMVAGIGIVRRRRPSAVLVLGGYASLACAVGAVIWRVPIIVADQNARAGAVNRLASRFAKACAVPFASTDLPRATVTGNPVRPEFLERAADRDPAGARRTLGLPNDGPVVAVFAGSLGARRINNAVWGALGGSLELCDGHVTVHHVIGARDWESRPEVPDTGPAVDYRPVRYEDRMAELMDAADLVVCRAGGTTVAELAVMGTPSILVPLPIATRDHQSANAAELVSVGAAVAVPDDQMDPMRFAAEVSTLLSDRSRLEAMGEAALGAGHPRAAAAVVDLLERHGR